MRGTTEASQATRNNVWFGSQLAEELDANNNTVTRQFYAEGERIGGVNYYYTRDHLGSVRELVEVVNGSAVIRARYDYDPYGRRGPNQITSGAVEADFGFTGHYCHAKSGLHLALFRAYDADTGRWLNRDPIGEDTGLNLFAYVGSDPINEIDPLGLWRWPDYISININIAIPNPLTLTLVGWSGTASIDRYGHTYWSPFGLGVGKSATAVSGSLTANWLDRCYKPTQKELDSFLTQHGFSGSAGFWGGVNQNYTPGSGWSTGGGFISPQAGLSYNYSFRGPKFGVSW